MTKLYSDRYTSGEKALSEQEYKKLLETISDLQDELLIRMAASTGLRREDLCSVEIGKINVQEGTLTFHEHKKDSVKREASKFVDVEGKRVKIRGKPLLVDGKVVPIERWRTINLQPTVLTCLEKFWRTLPKEERHNRYYLFSFRGRQAYNRFNAWCVKAGIPERPFHALRATCIKFCHANGWADEAISKLTGDSIAVIQAHYMTPSVSEMKSITQGKGFA